MWQRYRKVVNISLKMNKKKVHKARTPKTSWEHAYIKSGSKAISEEWIYGMFKSYW